MMNINSPSLIINDVKNYRSLVKKIKTSYNDIEKVYSSYERKHYFIGGNAQTIRGEFLSSRFMYHIGYFYYFVKIETTEDKSKLLKLKKRLETKHTSYTECLKEWSENTKVKNAIKDQIGFANRLLGKVQLKINKLDGSSLLEVANIKLESILKKLVKDGYLILKSKKYFIAHRQYAFIINWGIYMDSAKLLDYEKPNSKPYKVLADIIHSFFNFIPQNKDVYQVIRKATMENMPAKHKDYLNTLFANTTNK